jgi:hypothetical protein
VIAQGNALGHVLRAKTEALKGRNDLMLLRFVAKKVFRPCMFTSNAFHELKQMALYVHF